MINFTDPGRDDHRGDAAGARRAGHRYLRHAVGVGRRIAAALGFDPAETRLDYVGLNHLGWMRGVVCGGANRLPDLLADDDALATLEETYFGADWIRTLGCIYEYLYYYYFNRDAIAAIAAQDAPRGAFLTRQQNSFYAAAAAAPQRALALWEQTHAERRSLYMAEARSGGRGEPRPLSERTAGADGQPGPGQAPGGALASPPSLRRAATPASHWA